MATAPLASPVTRDVSGAPNSAAAFTPINPAKIPFFRNALDWVIRLTVFQHHSAPHRFGLAEFYVHLVQNLPFQKIL